ncbi:hypothetical protein L2747_13110 [Shewanella marinintestina]|uniref:hypothetical protein n=1 Tax=Shewanella marinintestina TaxID=190305 RepID=UPI00200FAC4C|nr:hypothetical protein [Shewanella marinintestina]MCL1146938.1 hypothetical protein [Shewanella marinintestina]
MPIVSTATNRQDRSNEQHWNNMTAEQKIALYDLNKFGFILLFVRQLPSGPQAFVKQHNTLATISKNGDVNYSPEVLTRQTSSTRLLA